MEKSPEVPGQGLVDVKSNGSTQTVIVGAMRRSVPIWLAATLQTV